MFSRKMKLFYAFCISLIVMAIVPAQKAQAEDPPPVPIFDVIRSQVQTSEVTQSCVTFEPLNPAFEIQEMAVIEIRENMVRIPFTRRGLQCFPLPPELINAIGLASDGKVVVPQRTEKEDAFNIVGGTPVQQLDVPLNPSIEDEFFEEAARQKAKAGYYTKVKGVFYLRSETTVSVASPNVIPPGPFEGESTSLMRRLTTLSDLYYDGIFIKLTPLTVLYTCKDKACDPITLAALCPNLDLDDVVAVYLGSYPVFKTFGFFTQTEMWTRIRHTPFTIKYCPQARPYQFLDGPTTWTLLDELYQNQVDSVIEGQREHLSRNIALLPQGGNPFAAPATFDTINDGGLITLLGIVVAIGGVLYYFIAVLEAVPLVVP